MLTLKASREESRFLSLRRLAQAMVEAPLNAKGVPCVVLETQREDGFVVFVATSGCPEVSARLVTADKDEGLLRSSLEYLTARLQAMGFEVSRGPARPSLA